MSHFFSDCFGQFLFVDIKHSEYKISGSHLQSNSGLAFSVAVAHAGSKAEGRHTVPIPAEICYGL